MAGNVRTNQMRLYATTTSERASKGQGGEWLDIIIYNEDKEPAIGIKVISNATGGVRATIFRDMRYSQIIVDDKTGFIEDASKYNQKGEKKKDYCRFCEREGEHITDNEGDMYCERCEMYQ
jgi:hypothetical protein